VRYLKHCYNKSVIPSPLFSKIQKGTLALIGYHINEGQAQALSHFLIDADSVESANIKTLILHNNGCSDVAFALLLKGLVLQGEL